MNFQQFFLQTCPLETVAHRSLALNCWLVECLVVRLNLLLCRTTHYTHRRFGVCCALTQARSLKTQKIATSKRDADNGSRFLKPTVSTR